MLDLRYGQGAKGVRIRERLLPLAAPHRGSLQEAKVFQGSAGREGVCKDASGGVAAPAPGGEK